ncbi:hypothetical protein ZIOFF_024134 [Zingiber officinale]|uniref:Uncharacterized protein n=1 Tax=Zingiber officinale TaxID=94328 RepID=A0A8J5LFX8_ZINOF|nr:hypothetical protein ZIOFF_024134 [Zingiber officinale]
MVTQIRPEKKNMTLDDKVKSELDPQPGKKERRLGRNPMTTDDVPIDSPNGRISCKLIAVDARLPKTKPVEEQLKLFKPPNSCKNVSILRLDWEQFLVSSFSDSGVTTSVLIKLFSKRYLI